MRSLSSARRLTAALLFGLVLSGAASVSASAQTPATPDISIDKDVPYGAGADLLLDVVRQSGASPKPVVMLIHGGGWSDGDKDKFDEESRALAVAGFVVFDINYTLATGSGPAYPRQVDEVHMAFDWIEEHAADYGGDPGRIGVLGGSAGGYLAAMLAFQVNTATDQPVAALASLSGPMDVPAVVTALRDNRVAADGSCAPLSCDQVAGVVRTFTTLLGCNPVDCPPELLVEASPTTYASKYSPPSFLANGVDERVSPQNVGMAQVLRGYGVPVETALGPGEAHSVELLPTIGPTLLQFLRDYVDVDPPATTTATSRPPSADPPVSSPQERHSRFPLRWIAVAILVVALGALIWFRLRNDTNLD